MTRILRAPCHAALCFVALSLAALGLATLGLATLSTLFPGTLDAQEPLTEPGEMGVESTGTEVGTDEDEPPALVGPVTRDEVEMAVPDWVQAQVAAEVDFDAAMTLANVEPGAEVTVYLGTWCSDSKRELSRLWRALDEAGGLVSFELSYIGVDRDKEQPEELIEGSDLAYVPTFIVRRDGEEVGRIVEEAPGGIVHDLTALLTGEATGVISARDDVGAEGSEGSLARPAEEPMSEPMERPMEEPQG